MLKRNSTKTDNEPVKRQRQTILSNSLSPTIPTLPPSATVSSPIEDRKSKFIGYFIPLTTSTSLPRMKRLIETLPDLTLADHRIMAWKVGRTTGYDDDGEKWAGRKVLDILVASEDEGLLTVVRWYGGIMLGPARFDHIVHVAADALATYHLSQRKSPIIASATMTAPTMVQGDEEERARLMRVLRSKDMTVETLRATITRIKEERGQGLQASPMKEKNYESMGMEGLKRLVFAREATIKSLREIHHELTVVPMPESEPESEQEKVAAEHRDGASEITKDVY